MIQLQQNRQKNLVQGTVATQAESFEELKRCTQGQFPSFRKSPAELIHQTLYDGSGYSPPEVYRTLSGIVIRPPEHCRVPDCFAVNREAGLRRWPYPDSLPTKQD